MPTWEYQTRTIGPGRSEIIRGLPTARSPEGYRDTAHGGPSGGTSGATAGQPAAQQAQEEPKQEIKPTTSYQEPFRSKVAPPSFKPVEVTIATPIKPYIPSGNIHITENIVSTAPRKVYTGSIESAKVPTFKTEMFTYSEGRFIETASKQDAISMKRLEQIGMGVIVPKYPIPRTLEGAIYFKETSFVNMAPIVVPPVTGFARLELQTGTAIKPYVNPESVLPEYQSAANIVDRLTAIKGTFPKAQIDKAYFKSIGATVVLPFFKASEIGLGIEYQMRRGIVERPVTAGIYYGAAVSASILYPPLSTKFPTLMKVANVALLTSYAGVKGYEYYQAPPRMGKYAVIGKALSTEVLPAIAGYGTVKGVQAATKAIADYRLTFKQGTLENLPSIYYTKGGTITTYPMGVQTEITANLNMIKSFPTQKVITFDTGTKLMGVGRMDNLYYQGLLGTREITLKKFSTGGDLFLWDKAFKPAFKQTTLSMMLRPATAETPYHYIKPAWLNIVRSPEPFFITSKTIPRVTQSVYSPLILKGKNLNQLPPSIDLFKTVPLKGGGTLSIKIGSQYFPQYATKVPSFANKFTAWNKAIGKKGGFAFPGEQVTIMKEIPFYEPKPLLPFTKVESRFILPMFNIKTSETIISKEQMRMKRTAVMPIRSLSKPGQIQIPKPSQQDLSVLFTGTKAATSTSEAHGLLLVPVFRMPELTQTPQMPIQTTTDILRVPRIPPPDVPGLGTWLDLTSKKYKLKSSYFRGGKMPRGYMPSFKSFVFNVRGAYKPGKYKMSGLDVRPITPKFKIMKMKKMKFGSFAT